MADTAQSKTFCVLPWIHLSTRPNGHMRLCCTANASSAGATNNKVFGGEIGILKGDDGKPANLGQTSLLEGWNNSYMRDVRRKMLNNEIPHSCTKCFKEEAAGHLSKRNWETEYWSKRVDVKKLIEETSPDGSVPAKVYYVDLRLGTKCNLKCVMCSPHDSSQWVGDWHKIYPQIQNDSLRGIMTWENQGQIDGASYTWHENNPRFWEELFQQIPNMQQLYFAGGEPTIIQEHYTLLEECIRRGYARNIELRYNSNGVVIPEKLFALWDHFKRVRFHYSIDSIFEMNHYIRYPTKWSQVETQLRRLDETGDNIEVTLACAIQALNIYYFPDFIKWKLQQKFKKINPDPFAAGMINAHFVYHPANLNVKVLPLKTKLAIKEKYEKFYIWLQENYRNDREFLEHPYGIKRLKGIVNFMLSEDWSNRMPEFFEYIQLIDKTRGLSFQKTFPELYELLKCESTIDSDTSRNDPASLEM